MRMKAAGWSLTGLWTKKAELTLGAINDVCEIWRTTEETSVHTAHGKAAS
jgi:hypothetical protein